MNVADIIDTLVRVSAELPAGELPRLRGVLAEADSIALSRLLTPTSGSASEAADVNLSAEEAARRLGVSSDWLYKNAKKLPCVRIGRRLLFSARGLERWNRQRQRY